MGLWWPLRAATSGYGPRRLAGLPEVVISSGRAVDEWPTCRQAGITMRSGFLSSHNYCVRGIDLDDAFGGVFPDGMGAGFLTNGIDSSYAVFFLLATLLMVLDAAFARWSHRHLCSTMAAFSLPQYAYAATLNCCCRENRYTNPSRTNRTARKQHRVEAAECLPSVPPTRVIWRFCRSSTYRHALKFLVTSTPWRSRAEART